jgi:hypothetical protein
MFSDNSRYNSLQANYLSIPVYIFACLVLAFVAWMSDKLKKRAVVVMLVPIPVLIGYAIVIGSDSHGAGLFAMFLVAAGKYNPYPSNSFNAYSPQASILSIPSSLHG